MSAKVLVLIYGESENDTGALKRLMPAVLPDGVQVEARPVRQPITLARDANLTARKKVASAIRVTEQGESRTGRKVLVVAHRDCDAVEPAHQEQGEQLKRDLENAGISRPVIAAPAWDIEAWWMLFPEALHNVRPCWRRITANSRRVGILERTKDRLIRELRPPNNAKCKDYRESDSLRIAEEIAKLGAITEAKLQRSASLGKYKYDLARALAA